MRLILYLLISSFSIFIGSYIIPGVKVESLVTILVVAIVLGILNTFLKPILVLLTLPITIITLGIFYLILNALIILLVSAIVPGFYVSGLWSAILFSVVISIVSFFLSLFLNYSD